MAPFTLLYVAPKLPKNGMWYFLNHEYIVLCCIVNFLIYLPWLNTTKKKERNKACFRVFAKVHLCINLESWASWDLNYATRAAWSDFWGVGFVCLKQIHILQLFRRMLLRRFALEMFCGSRNLNQLFIGVFIFLHFTLLLFVGYLNLYEYVVFDKIILLDWINCTVCLPTKSTYT